MSKFTIKVRLQGLEIEVEGTREDAPRIANQLGKQIGGLLQAPAALASENGATTIDAEGVESDNGTGKKKKGKKGGSGQTKTSADDITFVPDSQHGSPQQGWTQAQKAIWFLYIVEKQTNVTQLTAYSIAKNFNKYFKVSGAIYAGNVMRGLEKERLKSPPTVGADQTSGTSKYFLVTAGKTLAEKLAKGETVSTD
jgi:hypothetical protein